MADQDANEQMVEIGGRIVEALCVIGQALLVIAEGLLQERAGRQVESVHTIRGEGGEILHTVKTYSHDLQEALRTLIAVKVTGITRSEVGGER